MEGEVNVVSVSPGESSNSTSKPIVESTSTIVPSIPEIPSFIPGFKYRGPNKYISVDLTTIFQNLPPKFLKTLESNRENTICHRTSIFPHGRSSLWEFEFGLSPGGRWWIEFREFGFSNQSLFCLPKKCDRSIEIVNYSVTPEVEEFNLGDDQQTFFDFVEDWILFEDCKSTRDYLNSLNTGSLEDSKIFDLDGNLLGVLPPKDFQVIILNGAAGTGKSTILGKLNQEFVKRGLCNIEYYATANILCDDIKRRLGIETSKSICSHLMTKLRINFYESKILQNILASVRQSSIKIAPLEVSKGKSIRDAIKFQRLQEITDELGELNETKLNELYIEKCGSRILERDFDLVKFYKNINSLGLWSTLLSETDLSNMKVDDFDDLSKNVKETKEFINSKSKECNSYTSHNENDSMGQIQTDSTIDMEGEENIPKRKFTNEKYSNIKEEYYHLYKKYPVKRPRIVFIDEYTLLSNGLIDLKISIAKAEAFAGLPTLLVFVGDENQIKPLYQVPNADLKFLSKFKKFELKRQFRIKDDTFNNFLLDISRGDNVYNRILDYLKDKFLNTRVQYEYPINKIIPLIDLEEELLGKYAIEEDLFNVCDILMFAFSNTEVQFNNCSLAVHVAKSILQRNEISFLIKYFIQFQVMTFKVNGLTPEDYPTYFPFKLNEKQDGRIPITPLILGFEYKLLKPIEINSPLGDEIGVSNVNPKKSSSNEKIKLSRGSRFLLLKITDTYLVMCNREGLLIRLYASEFETNLINTSKMFGFPIQMYASETSYSAQGLTIDKNIYANLSGFSLSETYVVLSRVSDPEKIKKIYIPKK